MTNTVIYRNPQITLSLTEEDRKKCSQVRVKVFVDELGYPPTLETLDTKDAIGTLWLATCEAIADGSTVPVGTIRLLRYQHDDNVGVLTRLAVLSNARGLRLGQKLVTALEQGAKSQGMTAIMIEAVQEKRGFYESLGYIVEENDMETYIKDGTPHFKLWKRNL
ncbi:acyl-CoA N-acyltransferase [Fennellomyces sp. T-0311]|nr:acyl-CoA N-acyltransferase [Fennellomyces sp. T-0311]